MSSFGWTFWFYAKSMRNQIQSLTVLIKRWRWFWNTFYNYNRLAAGGITAQIADLYPQLNDATQETPVDPTYYYQDAWAFEKVVQQKPDWHIDVGSEHNYVALLSKVVKVIMVDIRPLPTPLASLEFRKGSILELPFPDASVPSASSLCVVEHIGLGRYGDPLDPKGTEKSIAELKRIIRPGGSLYLSIPIDDENRIYFNAHRAFREDYLLSLFAPFEVAERRYIYGNQFGDQLQNGFGTGCYHLVRASK